MFFRIIKIVSNRIDELKNIETLFNFEGGQISRIEEFRELIFRRITSDLIDLEAVFVEFRTDITQAIRKMLHPIYEQCRDGDDLKSCSIRLIEIICNEARSLYRYVNRRIEDSEIYIKEM